MNWQKAEEFVAALPVGTAVKLIREPKNPVDPLAVAVVIEGRKVGFVPRAQNLALGQMIDQHGKNLDSAIAMAFDESGGPVRAIDAKFFRSPNSGYPMVEIE